MQGERLEVLDRDAAVAVHDRLGQSCRAGGEQDVERRRERQSYELQRRGLGGELGPRDRAVRSGCRRIEVGQPHERTDAGQALCDRLDLGPPVDALGAVAVSVDRQDDRRLDLLPPVDDALRAELRRTRGEHCAEARRREQQDEGLRDVGRVGGDPVAGCDPRSDQTCAGTCDLVAQLASRQTYVIAALRGGDHDNVVVGAPRHAQHDLGVVEAYVREPHRAGHRRIGKGGRRITVGREVELPPHGTPEVVRLRDRPGPQLVVVGERAVEPPHELLEPRAAIERRAPEDVGHSGIVGLLSATLMSQCETR